jgi:hypothetical protein
MVFLRHLYSYKKIDLCIMLGCAIEISNFHFTSNVNNYFHFLFIFHFYKSIAIFL